ncbi:MAG: TPD domain-containing protein [Theionarchaea archaeon]|nr:TPD domain-containing protein [Theionarchaea archaeon]
MNEELYYRIYRKLNKRGDVFTLAEEFSIPRGVLFAILSQKIVRRTKRDYHGLKKQCHTLLKQWKEGKSLLGLSEERKFSPVLISSFVLREYGATKREIRHYLHHPPEIEDPRIRKEILEVLEEEVVYSPEAAEIQRENGRTAERKIGEWLDHLGVEYITEKEARDLHKKTPDFLMKNFFTVNENSISWVESKASFGDKTQMKGDYHRQLKPYVTLFGKGLVIYWHGYLNDSGAVQQFPYDSQIFIGNSQLVTGEVHV